MTDRINGFTVILEEDLREDDFQYVMEAVEMIKGVAEVRPNIVEKGSFAKLQTKHEIRTKVHKALFGADGVLT